MLAYFDASVLLSILLNEDRQQEAYEFWLQPVTRVSSILLKIETLVTIRRYYEQNKSKLDDIWLGRKTTELEEFLHEINFIIIDGKIEQAISLKKELANCRTLDAIHIATALEFRDLTGKNLKVYTFDKAMHELAEHYRFKTNTL